MKDNQIPWKDFMDNFDNMGAHNVLKFTLLVSLYVLSDFIEEKELILLTAIVEITRISTSSSIKTNELFRINNLANIIINMWSELYTSKEVTWSIHQVIKNLPFFVLLIIINSCYI